MRSGSYYCPQANPFKLPRVFTRHASDLIPAMLDANLSSIKSFELPEAIKEGHRSLSYSYDIALREHLRPPTLARLNVMFDITVDAHEQLDCLHIWRSPRTAIA